MLAIDLDGTVADTSVSARRALAQQLDLTLAPARTPMRELYAGVPGEYLPGAQAVLAAGFARDEHGVYSSAPPMPGAADALNWLARRQLLAAYITYRPAGLLGVTAAWLKQHGFPSAPILHAGEGGKAPLMRSVRASLLVDDDADTVAQVRRAGHAGVLFGAQPAGAGQLELRAPDWASLAGLLAALPLDYRERYERGF